jgi:N-acetylglucosaminyl-diphospho-decaprenol L-rhamnosyltransferase
MMSVSVKADVVIPVHGAWDLTRECLLSLRRQTVQHNVIVVDDAGGDETGLEIARHFPEVTLITLTHNSGFGTACNAGIGVGRAPFVVLLNNDAVAHPTFVEELVAVFDSDDGIGSVAPLVLKPSGHVEALGFAIDPTLSGHHRFANATIDQLEKAESFLLCGAYGAAAGFRRTTLDESGLFDENIFMYEEELDLALRLTSSGWKVAAAPKSHVTHYSGGTIGQHSPRQRRHASFSRGYIIRAYKLLGGRAAARVLSIEVLRCVGSVLKYRDLIAVTERVRGWNVGAQAPDHVAGTESAPLLDKRITLLTSIFLRMRLHRQPTTGRQTTSR